MGPPSFVRHRADAHTAHPHPHPHPRSLPLSCFLARGTLTHTRFHRSGPRALSPTHRAVRPGQLSRGRPASAPSQTCRTDCACAGERPLPCAPVPAQPLRLGSAWADVCARRSNSVHDIVGKTALVSEVCLTCSCTCPSSTPRFVRRTAHPLRFSSARRFLGRAFGQGSGLKAMGMSGVWPSQHAGAIQMIVSGVSMRGRRWRCVAQMPAGNDERAHGQGCIRVHGQRCIKLYRRVCNAV